MVHGGGFYRVQKLQMDAVHVPARLHWFKWESYWTWLSGVFLLALVFYSGDGALLLDSTVSEINYFQAVVLSILTIALSWFFYDFLWESAVAKNRALCCHIVTLVWFGIAAYVLCRTLSGRAAYMHLGAILGTWMSGNVFLRIIPRQVKMVEAVRSGEKLNENWAKNAKNRSTHNTYFTLPILFIMISNHFPSTYGNSRNWLVLLAISLSGALIRHFFVIRLHHPTRAKTFLACGVALLIGIILFTKEYL